MNAPWTPEDWAEWVAEGVWDVPALETREEFKAALIVVFEALASGEQADEREGPK